MFPGVTFHARLQTTAVTCQSTNPPTKNSKANRSKPFKQTLETSTHSQFETGHIHDQGCQIGSFDAKFHKFGFLEAVGVKKIVWLLGFFFAIFDFFGAVGTCYQTGGLAF